MVDVFVAEKRGEEAIRDQRWGVVGWVWGDLQQPERPAARIRRALEPGGR